MQFRVVPTDKYTTQRSLLYRVEEFSFDVDPAHQDSFTSILINNLNLEVTRDGKIVSVWGLSSYLQWHDATLEPPQATRGDLFVVPDVPFKAGVSQSLTPALTSCSTFVDKAKNWVKISGDTNPISSVMIIPGVIFDLDAAGHFSALWLRPQNRVLLQLQNFT